MSGSVIWISWLIQGLRISWETWSRTFSSEGSGVDSWSVTGYALLFWGICSLTVSGFLNGHENQTWHECRPPHPGNHTGVALTQISAICYTWKSRHMKNNESNAYSICKNAGLRLNMSQATHEANNQGMHTSIQYSTQWSGLFKFRAYSIPSSPKSSMRTEQTTRAFLVLNVHTNFQQFLQRIPCSHCLRLYSHFELIPHCVLHSHCPRLPSPFHRPRC